MNDFFRVRRLVLTTVLAATMLAVPASVSAWSAGTFDAGAENTLVSLINKEHTRVCGRGLLRAYQHNNLDRWRAKDMVVRNYFSHTILGTSNKAWNYFPRYGIGEWLGAGEILAWNAYPDSVSATTAFNQFMGSATHRALIQNCYYNAFGVGGYKDGAKRMFASTFSRQPVERVTYSPYKVKSGPYSSTTTLFYAYRYANPQMVFRHVYNKYGNRWDYGHWAGKGWGWAYDRRTN